MYINDLTHIYLNLLAQQIYTNKSVEAAMFTWQLESEEIKMS